MCVFFLSFALALLSPRLEGRAHWAWELSVIALPLGMGLALLFLTDDLISDRSTGVRTPDHSGRRPDHRRDPAGHGRAARRDAEPAPALNAGTARRVKFGHVRE